MSLPKGQSYTAELRIVERELKLYNAKTRAARERKRKLTENLYKYMQRNGISKVEGYTLDKVTPKQPREKPKPKKPEREKKRDIVELYRQVGILNPEQLYEETKHLQQ